MHFLVLLSCCLLCLCHIVAGQWSVTNSGTVLTFVNTNGSQSHLFEVELFTGTNGFVEVLSFITQGNLIFEFKHRLFQIVEVPAGSQYTPGSPTLSTFTVAAWNGFVGTSQNGNFVSTSNDPIGSYSVTVVPNLSVPLTTDPANTTFNLQVPKSVTTSRIGFLTLASAGERVNGSYVTTSLSVNDV